jgi:Mg2+-importing ATPase
VRADEAKDIVFKQIQGMRPEPPANDKGRYPFQRTQPAAILRSLFQTGWFVESLMTQTLIIHVIRTNKIPFIQSQASRALTFTTLAIMAFGIWLPYSPIASSLGFTHLPALYWPILVVTMLAYVVLTQGIKVWLLQRKWI